MRRFTTPRRPHRRFGRPHAAFRRSPSPWGEGSGVRECLVRPFAPSLGPRPSSFAPRPPRRSHRRGGTTLTEVLMSLLIMGIGLVSVATLFPLSVLRSIEATQQTTATSLRFTAEALIDGSGTEPVYVMGSDPLEFRPNPRLPMGSVNTTLRGCPTAAIALDPDGDHDPVANDTNYHPASHTYTYDGTDHREGFYVVDPLGYWRLRQQGEPHNASALPVTLPEHHGAQYFGDWTGVGFAPRFPQPGGGTVHWNINRFSLNVPNHHPSVEPPTDFSYLRPLFGFTGSRGSFAGDLDEINENAKRAELAVGLPDSFITVADGRSSENAVTIESSFVNFEAPAADDIAAIFRDPITGDPDWVMIHRGQVTVFAADGRSSVVRELDTRTDASGAYVWSSAAGDIGSGILRFKSPLPASLVAKGVDRVVVEAVEDRYTWMLTVRRRDPKSLIDVVVFFRRAFGRADERVYLVSQNFTDIAQFNQRKLEQQEYFVAWNSNDPLDVRPEIKEGDWMFDPVNFRWRKIGPILREEVINSSMWTDPILTALGFPRGTTYAADRKIVFRMEGAQPADEPVQRGIFMQGVVDVYPITPKGTGN